MRQRFVINNPIRVTTTLVVGEEPTDADGDVLVSVRRPDGSYLVEDATAEHEDDGQYYYDVPAQSTVTDLEVTWTAEVDGATVEERSVAEVCGGHFFSYADVRLVPELNRPEKYPTYDLRDRRIEVEDEFERICGRAFVPRFARQTFSGDGGQLLELDNVDPIEILSITVNGVDVTDEVKPDLVWDWIGDLRRDRGYWPRGSHNIVVEYSHGLPTVPTDIRRIGVIRARYLLLEGDSAIPSRATHVTVEGGGTYLLSRPNRQSNETGLPEVDAVLDRYATGVRGGGDGVGVW